MSDNIKHECGIVLIRLLKPLEHYHMHYGSWQYGLKKLYLLMQKQHNRGQDGAGAVCLKFDTKPGIRYIYRFRSNSSTAIKDIFTDIEEPLKKTFNVNPMIINDTVWAKENIPFAGELYLGHMRYGTFGANSIEEVHPIMRENNWKSRNLIIAGNFNLTNVDEHFDHLVELGQHPKGFSDTITILEKVGHFLDRENERSFRTFKDQGMPNIEISKQIAQHLNIRNILFESSKKWDGGYTIAGIIGHGDAFVIRDPWGIRPCFYYYDEDIAVVASERPVIQTALNTTFEEVKELKPGYGLIIKKNGLVTEEMIREPQEKRSCSFERIYFSRGSDQHIYHERKKLGEYLTPTILEAINHDMENTVFSYIPNTAETAFFGLTQGIQNFLLNEKKKKIIHAKNKLSEKELDKILSVYPRIEKIAVKDIKLRTFITEDKGRDDLVSHVYDITYGTVKKDTDTLVVIDDSIVRGTTLKRSILKILDRLEPKKIIIVSSAPQIRYPDCYGIDMTKLSDFIAFEAAISLLRERKKESVINDVYKKCKEQEMQPKEDIINLVKEIYIPFTVEEISARITQLLKPENIKAELQIIYQTIENLHKACPKHTGDWYFTGNYPTPGGNKVVNTSFINFIEGKNQRAY